VISLNPTTDALVIVDAQPTFMPGGGLPIREGDKIVPIIVNVADHFPHDLRVATMDMHPRGHISLASSYVNFDPYTLLEYKTVKQWTADEAESRIAPHALFNHEQLLDYLSKVDGQAQRLWPDHALDGSGEEEVHLDLWSILSMTLVKGNDPICDSYSGFFDNLGRSTGFGEYLKDQGVNRAFYCGLALDFCVGFTALDGLKYGIEAYVIRDACRSTDIPGSEESMMKKFAEQGVRLVSSDGFSSVK
jgi:nicotinamidase/pyrazinamidase